MPGLELWEQILIGVIALVALLFFGPGVKRTFQQTRGGTSSEWKGVIMPLAAVIVFVVLLILMVRGSPG